jgi:4-hydroxyproline epimerase
VLLSFSPSRADARARNFVLCPNGTFDRSPCGTGTSALLASMAARGELAPGAAWTQESAIGSVFEARYAALPDGSVRPSVSGRAFIVAEGALVFDALDPSRSGSWRESP